MSAKKNNGSKTALNGLNFITNDERDNLISKEQPNEVILLFSIILILLNEKYESIPRNKIIEYFFKEIFKQYKVETLKQLFLQNIIKNCNYLNNDQLEKIEELIKANPALTSSSDMFRINRNISYMTFILKEIIQFIFQKLSLHNKII